MRDTSFGEDFPGLADLGPVSHTMGRNFPLHEYMLATFLKAVGRGEVKRSNVKNVRTKGIYSSRMCDLLLPPKVELKYPQVNFQELVYPRLRNDDIFISQSNA